MTAYEIFLQIYVSLGDPVVVWQLLMVVYDVILNALFALLICAPVLVYFYKVGRKRMIWVPLLFGVGIDLDHAWGRFMKIFGFEVDYNGRPFTQFPAFAVGLISSILLVVFLVWISRILLLWFSRMEPSYMDYGRWIPYTGLVFGSLMANYLVDSVRSGTYLLYPLPVNISLSMPVFLVCVFCLFTANLLAVVFYKRFFVNPRYT